MGNKVIGIIIDFVKALQSKDRALISIESNRTYPVQNTFWVKFFANMNWNKINIIIPPLLSCCGKSYQPKICGITHIDNMFTVKMMNQC